MTRQSTVGDNVSTQDFKFPRPEGDYLSVLPSEHLLWTHSPLMPHGNKIQTGFSRDAI